MAIVAIVIIGLLALSFLPQMWVKSVIARHSQERPEFPGTGGQFARYVLDGLDLGHVSVEETELGDHYDPQEKVVRLTKDNMRKKSLSAIVIATHEVGHAMQDATRYRPLAARTTMAQQANRIQSLGMTIMIAAPLMMLFTKSPFLMLLQILAGVAIIATTILMHLLTLPVEFDASFNRALPLLEAGKFLNKADKKAARTILWAAALTYVAAAAMSLLNVMRWIRLLRF